MSHTFHMYIYGLVAGIREKEYVLNVSSLFLGTAYRSVQIHCKKKYNLYTNPFIHNAYRVYHVIICNMTSPQHTSLRHDVLT